MSMAAIDAFLIFNVFYAFAVLAAGIGVTLLANNDRI